MTSEDEVLATISASPPRRWIGLGALYGLALLVIYVALAKTPALGWQVFLILIGGGALWMAERMRAATSRVIELTEHELRDTSGQIIVRLEDIQKLDRGLFTFKPSNGFLMRTKHRVGPRVWQPGLWWRIGRQVGIGGVTPGRQTKAASEMIAMILARREFEQK